jgi:poly(A) polymerase/tRNA nucleotidyltransferase (CCA-adding enzyme)
MIKFSIPREIGAMAARLEEAGFSAYLVGGCVRDLLLGREPKDWDIATDAKPEAIQKLFPDSVYENEFGTVLVKLKPQIGADKKSAQINADNQPKSAPEIIEVTTFRKEEKYSDLRHPDKIEFTDSIEADLARRDFTINAIALRCDFNDANTRESSERKTRGFESFGWDLQVSSRFCEIIDPFGGQEDLKKKLIKAVGEPEARFNEDALRLMRAVRFAAELGFAIEERTAAAIKENANLLGRIAKERVRDELIRIIMSPSMADLRGSKRRGGPSWGINQLEELGLLRYVMPELREGIGVTQNKHHIYTVWEHNLRALDYAARKNYSLEVRLAALLHDIGKPRTKRGEGPDSTFYNHEVVGAKMTVQALDRLRFPKRLTERVAHLVRWHLFYYNVGEVTEAGVRRFLRRVGPENVDDLMKVREADRIGSGVPKAFPYKLRHLKFMIEKVKRDPISPKMLAVKGDEVMKILGLPPGPKVGWILNILLEEVIDEPSRNEGGYLQSRIKELGRLQDEELEKLARKSKERKEEFESGLEAEMKKKFYVK